jgi:hypothetical protein
MVFFFQQNIRLVPEGKKSNNRVTKRIFVERKLPFIFGHLVFSYPTSYRALKMHVRNYTKNAK